MIDESTDENRRLAEANAQLASEGPKRSTEEAAGNTPLKQSRPTSASRAATTSAATARRTARATSATAKRRVLQATLNQSESSAAMSPLALHAQNIRAKVLGSLLTKGFVSDVKPWSALSPGDQAMWMTITALHRANNRRMG